MSLINRNSYEGLEVADLTSIIAEFPEGDEMPGQMIPVMKLSGAFDSCARERENLMKVYLKIRPILNLPSTESTLVIESDRTIRTNAPDSLRRAQYAKLDERKYAYTKIFSIRSKESEIYNTTLLPLLHNYFYGENCLLFLYGMMNSDKANIMQGNQSNTGILSHLISKILMDSKKRESSSDSKFNPMDLQMSVLEIYGEKIYDLLNDNIKKEKLIISDKINGTTDVGKLSSHSVSTHGDFLRLLDSSSSRSINAVTGSNFRSNKSHIVYVFTMNQKNKKPVVFHCVDLACAERSSKATAQHEKESNKINLSLMHLWRCLEGIKSNKNLSTIPLRGSKLTHLLLPSFLQSGLGNVVMIASVSPHIDDYDETLSVLVNTSMESDEKENINEKEKEKVGQNLKVKKFSKYFTSAASAILAAAARGKKRRAGHDNLSSKPTPGKDPILSLVNKRDNTDINTRILKPETVKLSHVEKVKSDEEEKSPKSLNQNFFVTKFVSNVEIEENFDECEDDNFGKSETSDGSAVKKMRIEIERLQGENEDLLNEQFTRETEIRVEVSLEMALRSGHLLDQLQDLQKQLDEQGKKEGKNIKSTKKACKNIRKNQIEKENEEMSKDLEEAEEELERIKLDYERQITELMKEKNILADELVGLKAFNSGKNDLKKLSEVLEVLKASPPRVHTNSVPVVLKSPVRIQDPLLISNPENFSKKIETQNSYQKFLTNSGSSERLSPKPSNTPKRDHLPQWTEEKENLISPFTEEKTFQSNIPKETINEKVNLSVSKLDEKEKLDTSKEVPINIYSNFIASIPSNVPIVNTREASTVLPATRLSSILLLRAKIKDENDSRNSVRIEIPRKSIADEFSERMQRDRRFKKNVKVLSSNSATISSETDGNIVSLLKRGVMRSPLSPVREDINSPVKAPEDKTCDRTLQSFIWDKSLKSSTCDPPVTAKINWEQSLRGMDRDPASNRFTTKADRSVSPLSRLGRSVVIQQSQLVECPEHLPPPPKASLPPRPPHNISSSKAPNFQNQVQPQAQAPQDIQSTFATPVNPIFAVNIKLPPSFPMSTLQPPVDGSITPKVRAKVVTARRVISTRIAHQESQAVEFGSSTHAVDSVSKLPSSFPISTLQPAVDGSITPKVRAKVVTARRVISTRIAHQEPQTVEFGSNPNAGDYISRLRTRNFR